MRPTNHELSARSGCALHPQPQYNTRVVARCAPASFGTPCGALTGYLGESGCLSPAVVLGFGVRASRGLPTRQEQSAQFGKHGSALPPFKP